MKASRWQVGDPAKDTAGPSLHVLIKLLSTVTLVAAPLFVRGSGRKGTHPLIFRGFPSRTIASQEHDMKQNVLSYENEYFSSWSIEYKYLSCLLFLYVPSERQKHIKICIHTESI